MEKLVFRQYKDTDKEQVKHLHKIALEAVAAFHKGGTWDDDLEKIPEVYFQGGDFLVGLMGDKIIAMGAFKKIADKVAEIKRMRVAPGMQGQGIGQTILEKLESRAKQLGFTTLQLDTTVKQIAAQKLYEKNGYIEVRREIDGWPLETIFYRKEII